MQMTFCLWSNLGPILSNFLWMSTSGLIACLAVVRYFCRIAVIYLLNYSPLSCSSSDRSARTFLSTGWRIKINIFILSHWSLRGLLHLVILEVVTEAALNFCDVKCTIEGLPRWLSGLRHSAHRPERSAGGAGVQSPGRPVDFMFGFQGHMLWD